MSQSNAPGETVRRTRNQCRLVVTFELELNNPLPFGVDAVDVLRPWLPQIVANITSYGDGPLYRIRSVTKGLSK